jgi:phenylacetate-CoA ligase
VEKLLVKYQELDYVSYDGRFDHLIDQGLQDKTKDKKSVIRNFADIYQSKYKHKILKTSGTSGSGLIYPVSRSFLDNLWAVYWKFRACHGVYPNDWFVYFIGQEILSPRYKSSRYWLKVYPSRQLLMSQYHLGPETVESYLNKIYNSGIKCMHGYPSTLAFFCQLIRDNGLQEKAKNCGIKFISVSSECLSDAQKDRIESVFHCKVVQIYGMTEGVVNIYECDQGSLHVDEYFASVDFEHCEGNDYRVVGSSFHNQALPLFKYDTQDVVELELSSKCTCGRKSRLVKNIIGRQDDYVSLPDGRKIGRLDHIFKGMTNISEAQIFQHKDYSIDFRVVTSSNYSLDDEKLLAIEIDSRFKGLVPYKIVYLEKIKRSKAGKIKAVESEVV